MTLIRGKLTKGTWTFDNLSTGVTGLFNAAYSLSRDDDAMHTANAGGTGFPGFVVKRAGIYVISYSARMSYFPGFIDNMSCVLRIKVNNAFVEGADADTSPSRIAGGGSEGRFACTVTWTPALVANDYIQLDGNRNAQAGAHDVFTEVIVACLPFAT
jgi:hypothetical protein